MKKNIAFFDFDGTITHEDTFTPFIYQSLDAKAIRRGKLRLLPYILAWKMGWLSASAIRQKVFHYAFAGKSQPEILQRGNDHSLAFIPRTLRENAMQRIAWHQARGDTVVVVSASLDVYLRPWCQQHNLELLCSEVEFQNGAATGKYQGGDCSGLAKKARILANYALTDYEAIFAHGDTPEDFAMLALATTQIYRWDEAPPCD
ncbi:HAD-IB family hydrolase [Klebsiella quasipneumoniae]|uniref:HAD-IB family hydrolase n=1 Tax=Klebsiella quasipneumoniae TaxID=1463165 RepID=UPI00240536EA|nr:HAD-IB family hydrolase [Klebsiella quasipneumoniae]MDG0760496.1 HAD-IB family hydrolase [Klebsiella quasipneumoniae]